MVRRGLVQDVGGFEECFTGDNQLYEDQAFLIKVYLKGSVYASGETLGAAPHSSGTRLIQR